MKFQDTYFYRCANNPYIRFPKPWDTYFTLPVSVPVSEWLCKTKMKPNTVSVISLLVALVAAASFYRGDRVSLIVGALIFQISYILDCADGYIARKKRQTSQLGHWLDHTFDEIKKPVLLIGLLMGQNALHSVAPWGWIAALLYIFSRVLVKTDSTIKHREMAEATLTPTGGSNMLLTVRQKWLFEHFGIVIFFTSIESQAISFVIGPICGFPLSFILVAAALSVLWFVYVDGFRYWRNQFRIKQSANSKPCVDS
ncbi:CDP-alcohol phosphatidyltransferase family protein [Alicyclobacillus acidiphilus]|uniref:CDP-alcohol phosphatidyltransferase family protein n=1 Tax=Alicyclobacillus acidiphilus TaxID=182455 RepID=UPI0008363CFE|nr:CDP-alcohol phosphatidyltransferase family protein [Alicyclobacillus acidiphilus]